MAIQKTLKYYWDHPNEYKRLKSEDLNNEAAIKLLEAIIKNMQEEQDTIVDQLEHNQNDEDARHHVVEIVHDLQSDFVGAISFGHQDEMIRSFLSRCPKGVMDVGSEKKDGRISSVYRPVN